MLVFFKSNIGIMFFAASTGLVLLSNLDPVVISAASAVVPGEGEAYVRLSVVLLSIVFAGLLSRGTTKGSAIALNTMVAVILGLVMWVLLPTATGVSWLLDTTKQQYWQDVNDYKAVAIGIGLGLSLISVLLLQNKPKTKH